MSKEELKKLESKIDRLSKQLRDIVLERRTERRRFFRGLILGLILGILGNLFVSSWMEYLKAFGMPSWGWALGVVVGLLALAYISWQFDIESRR